MVQEEVAQKIMKKSGRGYGFPSLFFQRYLVGVCLIRFPPDAFFPPPKVHSRLLYFKPHYEVEPILTKKDFGVLLKHVYSNPVAQCVITWHKRIMISTSFHKSFLIHARSNYQWMTSLSCGCYFDKIAQVLA